MLLDGGDERDRVEGIQRDRMAELAAAAGVELALGDLPERRVGCASLTRDPEVAARLAARRARAEGRIRSRELRVGELEDPFEALHDRGLTDGLPVVPPTPERVVEMLEHTSRDPQDVVAVLPPYGAEATVEKVAINAVMAGCAGPELPVVLAAVEAAGDEAFAMHGLLATTHPAGPVIVVSGYPGFNTGVNVLGQGDRASMTTGRALQLTVRNVGGGRPGVEDRAAHGQPGKLGMCFAERLDDSAPWPGLAQARGVPEHEPGVTLMALEAPRVIVDQLAREPEGLCASLALALENVATPRAAPRLRRDAARRPRARPDLQGGGLEPRAGPAAPARAHALARGRARARRGRLAGGPRRRTGSATPRCRWRSSPRPTASCSPTPAVTPACSAWSSEAGPRAR